MAPGINSESMASMTDLTDNGRSQDVKTRQETTDRPIPGVGDEIRTVRKARGLTLKELSQRTNCSAAYLSRIERGEARISIEMLTDIGTAMNVDPKWFFPTRKGVGSYEKAFVVRADARRSLSNLYTRSYTELGFEDELLSSSLSGECYMMMTRFPPGEPGHSTIEPGFIYEGEQHGIVVKGEIELILDDELITLKTGDSFSYPTEIPHRLRNNTPAEALVIITMRPVRISW